MGWIKKIWYFLWEDDSILSWLANVVVAFVLIKFVIFPGMGFVLGTTHPVVAVVSGSMEHTLVGGRICGEAPMSYANNLESWWATCGDFYQKYNITFDSFKKYPFRNGFNTGDIMVLTGITPENVKVGDVIVFQASKPDPIIHRVIDIRNFNNLIYYTTKGDHNPTVGEIDANIPENVLIGKARFRIPVLGYIKIWFVELLRLLRLDAFIRIFNAR